MKKLTITLSVLLLCCFAFFLKAQSIKVAHAGNAQASVANKYSSTDWLDMMRDQTVNIHDVQNAFNEWYSIHHKADKDKTNAKNGEDEDGAYEFFKRWEWFNLSRVDANGNRPDPYKIGSEYQQYLNARQRQAHRPGHNVGSTGTWTYVGNTAVPSNGGGDGRVNRVRTMPGNNNIMFACAPSGGLWETTNGGSSWSTNTDQLGDLSTSDIAINPLKTNIMYLATGDGDGIQSIYPTPATIGVLKSYDGGITWVATGLSETLSNAGANEYSVNELLIDPNDTSVIIAATTFGIYRSANSGSTWTMEKAGWYHSIEFEPSHPSIVYAGGSSLSGGGVFYRSTNNGVTWTQITAGLPTASQAEGFEIAVTAADTDDVYILADSTGTFGFEGLYLSTNHGVSFSTQSLFSWIGVPNVLGWACDGSDNDGQGWYTLSMAVSQTNADSLWVGGVNIWSSTDGGQTWALNTDWTGGSCGGEPYVHADIHSIQFIPGNSKGYVVGCDGGVFITFNSGSTWTDISNNLEIGQQYCVGASALTSGKWITGWQDNGTNLSTSPWTQTYGGDGMDCFISWASDNDMYAENGEGELACTTDGGTNWNGCTSGITENGSWVTPWLEDPKTSTTFYSGFVNVWKSTGSMTPSWSKISTWGSLGITAIAVDSSNPNYIYAAQSNKIELTTNGGTSWSNITGSLPSPITGIAVNSKMPSHVWVTIGSYTSGEHVYASTNSGGSWTNITSDGSGLPNLPANCIVSESGSPNAIYVGTDQGVYYHDTVTNSWVFYNSGLPMVMIGDLTIYQPGGGKIIAATYGRGTWESPLYTTAKPIAYFDGVSTSVCEGNSVIFTDTSSNSPDSWKWTFTGGTPSSATTQTVSVVYSTPGNYAVKLVVSNSNGSDSLTKNSYITVNTDPSASFSSTSDVLCHGGNSGSATAAGSGGASPYTYSWSGGGTSATKSGLSAGTYSVTVTDHNGCTTTASTTITQPSAVTPSILSHTNVTTCYGATTGSATATASGGTAPYTYSWTGGGNNATQTGLSGGTYTVTITDNNGCTASTSVVITQPTGMTIITDSVNVNSSGACNGSALVNISGGKPPYTYSWSPGGGTNDTISGKCAGTYCCTITDNNNCSQIVCVHIKNITGIENINNASDINIYPDPNNGSFTITGVIAGQVIELYNDLGQKLSSSIAANNTMYFNISGKADGIYMVRILNKDGSLVKEQKLLKAQ